MPADHYVSQFHLREFCDPASLTTRDPWLWVGNLRDESVRRRSPKNVGRVPNLFAGPGALSDSDTTIETFLANQVEGPGAPLLRALCAGTAPSGGNLPSEVMRYLAWAASRSLVMQRVETKWAARFEELPTSPLVEPPPDGLMSAPSRRRPVRLIHPTLGERLISEADDATGRLDSGWIPDLTDHANFLESAHIQAYYFQVRWFPRLRWFTLRPPEGLFFIIGDRPVGWGVPDCLDAPPSCLRDPAAFLVAPLGRGLALVGRNHPEPWSVTPSQVNAMLAAWSHEWIAGPSAATVADAMRGRLSLKEASHPGAV
jgi:hypothetical protein